MMGISEIAVSSGSACTSASLEPSYVLRSMGVGDDLAHSSVRFGFGRYTTMEEVNYAADKVLVRSSGSVKCRLSMKWCRRGRPFKSHLDLSLTVTRKKKSNGLQ